MNKKQIRKMQTAAGGGLVYDDGKNIERTNYNNWSKLSFVDKMKRRFNIAKHQFNESSSPIINSVGAIFGEYDPKNPDLNTGIVNAPSRGINPKTVQNVAKGVRTLEDYLKTTKVSAPILEGSSMARNSYATDRFIGGRMFQNTLPEEAMKIQGHGMAKSPTIQDALARLRYILDNGIKGKFYTAPLKVSKEAATAGEAMGTGGATPYFDGHFLITGKPGQMINSVDDIGTVYINDAYENEEALKAAQKLQQYLQQTYPKINFKLYSQGFKQGGKMNILEFLKNGSGIHIKPSQKGSFTKYCNGKVTEECIRRGKNSPDPKIRKKATFAQNARRWKHKEGGKAFVTGVNVLDSNPKVYKYVKKKYRMHQYGGEIINNSPIVDSHFNWIQQMSDYLIKKKELDDQKKMLEMQEKQQKSNTISNILGSAINYGLDFLVNKPKTTSSTNSFNTPYLGKQNKVGTINSNGSMNTGIGGLTYNWNTDTFGSNNIMNGFNKISLT